MMEEKFRFIFYFISSYLIILLYLLIITFLFYPSLSFLTFIYFSLFYLIFIYLGFIYLGSVEISRQGNFIFAILLVYFVFFGYIANVYEKSIGLDIMFLYKVLFNPSSYFSTIILILIVFFLVFRETFFEYGVRNSIMLTPVIIGLSWIWAQFINGFDVEIIPYFFIRLEGYITILTLLGINFLSAIVAAILKEVYKEYLRKSQEIKNI